MKTLLILSLILFGTTFSTSARADEAYQMDHVTGQWMTLDSVPITLQEMEIVLNNGNVTALFHCWGLRVSGVCHRYEIQRDHPWLGHVSYSAADDSLAVIEDSSSPTPQYSMRVDPDHSDQLTRQWGNIQIKYFSLGAH
jgi:hypothetical protein